jgi:hypothetical protein
MNFLFTRKKSKKHLVDSFKDFEELKTKYEKLLREKEELHLIVKEMRDEISKTSDIVETSSQSCSSPASDVYMYNSFCSISHPDLPPSTPPPPPPPPPSSSLKNKKGPQIPPRRQNEEAMHLKKCSTAPSGDFLESIRRGKELNKVNETPFTSKLKGGGGAKHPNPLPNFEEKHLERQNSSSASLNTILDQRSKLKKTNNKFF